MFGKLKRAFEELRVGPVVPLSGLKVRGELEGLRFGLRCVMSEGGFKYRPQGMSASEVKQRADSTATMCANLHLMVRCAEDVILRHGLVMEYRSQLKVLEEDLGRAYNAQSEGDQLAATRAMVKAVQDGVDV